VSKDPFRLDGRVALVIGSGGGSTGTAVALTLAQAGARIVGADVSSELLDGTRDVLQSHDADFCGVKADVTDSGDVRRAVAKAWDVHGRIDCLVNVVGGTRPDAWARLDEYPDAVFEAQLALNLRYVLTASREVAARMIACEMPGSIVNFASISAMTSAPYHGGYGAAKAGVISLTRTMAVEWAPLGIRVNVVAPGVIQNPRTATLQLEANDDALGRGLAPVEIARAIQFLLSDAASGITGQVVHVDAGLSAGSTMGPVSRFAEAAARHTGEVRT
jgi:3-oxoacyl-[acyl-carrier protein] reductase